MDLIFSFPKDLQKIFNNISFTSDHFAFSVYTQEISHIKPVQVYTSMHSLILVQSGEKYIYTKNGNYKISAGQGLFLKSDSYKLSNIVTGDNPYKAILLFFDNTLLIETISNSNIFHMLNDIKNQESDIFTLNTSKILVTITESFETYIHVINNTPSCVYTILPLVKHKFEELFLYLSLEYSDIFCEFVRNIMKEHDLNIDMISLLDGKEYLNVSEMAKIINTDQASFSRKFKSIFGLSPKNWIDEKRFDRAIALLQSSNKNIQEICLECGFSSPSWFIERFKKRYNQTPKQYQKSKNLYFLS